MVEKSYTHGDISSPRSGEMISQNEASHATTRPTGDRKHPTEGRLQVYCVFRVDEKVDIHRYRPLRNETAQTRELSHYSLK